MNNKTRRIDLKIILMIFLVILSLGLSAYFWNEARQAKSQTPQAVQERNSKETERILDKLKAVLLIDDEGQPTVARVDNPDKLKKDNPDFYKNAQKDDYIIVYKQRAIIFRNNDRGKIINIAPIVNTNKTKNNKKTPKSQSDKTKSTKADN